MFEGLRNIMTGPDEVRSMVNSFHKDCYDPVGTWSDTCLPGTPGWKLPPDLWINQEMLPEARPDFIVETGSAWRASAGFAV